MKKNNKPTASTVVTPIEAMWRIQNAHAAVMSFLRDVFPEDLYWWYKKDLPFYDENDPEDNTPNPEFTLIVTGSLLFPLNGIQLNRSYDDVDFIIVTAHDTEMKQKFMMLNSRFPKYIQRPSNYFDDSFYYDDGHDVYNFCIQRCNKEDFLDLDKIRIIAIGELILWKLRRHRSKDIEDLEVISKHIEYLEKAYKGKLVKPAVIGKLKIFARNQALFLRLQDKYNVIKAKAEAEKKLKEKLNKITGK